MRPFFGTFIALSLCFPICRATGQAGATNTAPVSEERKEIRALLAAGKLDEALAFAQHWVATNEMRFGKETVETAQSLFSLAGAYYYRGDLTNAESLYQRCLNIREKALTPEHPDIANTLFALANLYSSSGNYSKAKPLMQRCLQIREKVLGPEHPDTADSLQGLGVLHRAMGESANAEQLYQRSLAIREKVLGPEDPDVADSLQSLGNLYWDAADYAKAEPLYQRSLRIREKILGPEHPDTAAILNNLAILYQTTADFAKAEPLYKRSFKIREKAYGPDHPDTADSLQSLGFLYQAMGDYTRSESFYQRGLKIREKVLGPDHPDTADSLQSLGDLYWDMGAYAQAEPLMQRCLRIREKVLGPQHPDTAVTLNNLASLCSAMGDYAKAEPLYQRSLRIREQILGPEHPDTAVTLNNLAGLCSAMGDYTNAEVLYQRSLKIREKVLGPEHPNTVYILRTLASFYILRQKPLLALDFARRGHKASEHILGNILAFAPEQQRDAYQRKQRPYDDLATLGSAPDLTEAVLHTKGIVLDSLLEDTLAAASSTNAETRNAVEELRSAGRRLIRLQTAVSTNRSAETAKRKQAEQSALEAQVDELQEALARNVASVGQTRRALKLTVSEVESALGKDAVLLEFVRYNHLLTMTRSETRYGVVLIGGRQVAFKDAGPGDPVWVPLGSAETIEKTLKEYRAVMRGEKHGEASLLSTLYTLLFNPVQQRLPKGISTLVISPDAELNFVNLATLLDGHDKFLAEKYTIKYVSSGRDLVFGQKAGKGTRRLSAFANPAFGDKPGLVRTSDTNRTHLAMLATDQRDYAGVNLPPLPGTAIEARYLRDKSEGWKLDGSLYEGMEASEAEVRAVKSPYVLHLATHGFFLPDTLPTNRPDLGMRTLDEGRLPVVWHNPMQRSGLAFAGAQLTLDAWKRGETPDPENDGILMAQEVGTMDLKDTWLVVLSACDTGVGEARAGEGVLGLRRGFIQAGAQNLMMTLWPVSDRWTMDMMKAFYERALKDGDAPGSLAQVQREYLVKLKEQKGPVMAARLAGPFLMTFQGRLVASPSPHSSPTSTLWRKKSRMLGASKCKHIKTTNLAEVITLND